MWLSYDIPTVVGRYDDLEIYIYILVYITGD